MLEITNCVFGTTSLEFTLKNASFEEAKCLHDKFYNGYPVLAFEFVNIIKNTSCVQNQLLAQRFNAIRLKVSDTTIPHLFKDCCKKGCPKCMLKFCLSVQAVDTVSVDVRALACSQPGVSVVPAHVNSTTPEILLELLDSQEVILDAYAVWHDSENHHSKFAFTERLKFTHDTLNEEYKEKGTYHFAATFHNGINPRQILRWLSKNFNDPKIV